MKISKQWLFNYISSEKSNEELEDYFTQLGLECTFDSQEINYENIVVGYIKSCKKHPNADRLNVCEVDVGNEILNIVCGAPNVKEKYTVAVAKVNAKVGDFKIKRAKIRGEKSNGMICSGKELGINDNHDGIMILSEKLELGVNIKDALSVENDTIFDFDITPNRGDCFSHIGIARELSVIEDKKINLSSIKLNSSDFNTSDLVQIEVKDSLICPRYACRIVKNVKIGHSPDWLKARLAAIGHKSINNVVDLANYIMLDLGQPLHTFDYDKINGQKIEVRYADKDEKIVCLDNQIKKLSDKDIVIADSSKPIAIAGIIGGKNTEVDEKTVNILIESAVFDDIHIRRSAKKHGYITDASKRFERGIDYSNVVYAMNKYIELLKDEADVKVSSDFIDIKDQKLKNKEIKFSLTKCNDFLGTNLNVKECEKIFDKLEIVTSFDTENYICIIPSYRNDLSREVDLFEEIARVYGYNNIKSNHNFSISSNSFIEDDLNIETEIRNILSLNGFNEHYSNSLYSESDVLVNKNFKPVELENPLSQDMKYLRNDLLPGLLKTASYNEKRGQENLKIFEIGSITRFNAKKYNKSDEDRMLGVLFSLNYNTHWKHTVENDIYIFKGEIANLIQNLNIDSDYDYKNDSILINNNKKNIGEIYLIDNDVLNQYNIKTSFAYCFINIDKIKNNKNILKYNKLSTYPSITRDISILVDKSIRNQIIVKTINENGGKNLMNVNLFDLYFDSNENSGNQSLAYSLTFQSNEKTLTDKEIDKSMKKIISALKNEHKVIQR